MKQACTEYALEQEKLLNEAKKQKKEEKKAAKEAKESTPQEGEPRAVLCAITFTRDRNGVVGLVV